MFNQIIKFNGESQKAVMDPLLFYILCFLRIIPFAYRVILQDA